VNHRVIFRILFGLLLSSGAAFSGNSETSLAGSEWRPEELSGQQLEAEVSVFLQFRSEAKISGLSGCNRFTGQYSVENGLVFSGVATTRRACIASIMELEQEFLAVLGATRGYVRSGIRLEMHDGSGQVLAIFRQTDWD